MKKLLERLFGRKPSALDLLLEAQQETNRLLAEILNELQHGNISQELLMIRTGRLS